MFNTYESTNRSPQESPPVSSVVEHPTGIRRGHRFESRQCLKMFSLYFNAYDMFNDFIYLKLLFYSESGQIPHNYLRGHSIAK